MLVVLRVGVDIQRIVRIRSFDQGQKQAVDYEGLRKVHGVDLQTGCKKRKEEDVWRKTMLV